MPAAPAPCQRQEMMFLQSEGRACGDVLIGRPRRHRRQVPGRAESVLTKAMLPAGTGDGILFLSIVISAPAFELARSSRAANEPEPLSNIRADFRTDAIPISAHPLPRARSPCPLGELLQQLQADRYLAPDRGDRRNRCWSIPSFLLRPLEQSRRPCRSSPCTSSAPRSRTASTCCSGTRSDSLHAQLSGGGTARPGDDGLAPLYH